MAAPRVDKGAERTGYTETGIFKALWSPQSRSHEYCGHEIGRGYSVQKFVLLGGDGRTWLTLYYGPRDRAEVIRDVFVSKDGLYCACVLNRLNVDKLSNRCFGIDLMAFRERSDVVDESKIVSYFRKCFQVRMAKIRLLNVLAGTKSCMDDEIKYPECNWCGRNFYRYSLANYVLLSYK